MPAIDSIEVFNGNVKYFFLYIYKLQRTDIDICIIVTTKNMHNLLSSYGLPVCLYPSIKAIIHLLETNVIVVDQGGWFQKSTIYWAPQAKIVQLWHGVGFKLIGKLSYPKFYVKLGDIFSVFPIYDLLISTSNFYTKNVFSQIFNSKKIIECGYPRNDIIFHQQIDEHILIEVDNNTLEKIIYHKNKGIKVILYVPTHRKSGVDPIINQIFDFTKVDEFAKQNNIIFVIKPHPCIRLKNENIGFENIINYHSQKDVYPLFNYIDVMITDYSSIYMDYLLLNRPVIFFCPDYDEYSIEDINIQFDYDWITPGPKCKTLDELIFEIYKVLNGIDENEIRRKEIADIAFRYIDDQSSKRILREIETNILH